MMRLNGAAAADDDNDAAADDDVDDSAEDADGAEVDIGDNPPSVIT